MKSSCDVIHDASILLDIRPACVVELSVARFARTKDQTARGTWPRKHSVHGLVAQKRRAGVLATAEARAWPTLHAAESGLQGNAETLHDADHVNLPKHNLPDPKMLQDPRKGAIRAGDPDMRHHPGDILGLGKDADREREIRES